MYLEEIEVQNWRGIGHQKLKLAPGLNIIYGPNESGKSSLRQAIRSAFLQNPTSKTRDALAVKTWGAKASPIVRVDFHLGRDRWSVEKHFFSPKGSRLRKNGTLIAADGDVHRKLEELLSHAVWLGSLWSDQGDTNIGEVPRELRGKLVAEEVVSPGLIWLEDQLKRQEDEFWTPTGRPKKKLQDVRDRAMTAEEAADDAQAQLQDTDTISEAVAEMHDDLQQVRAEEVEVFDGLAEMREKVGAWDRHRAALAEWNTRVGEVPRQAQWLERWDRTASQVVAKYRERESYRARLTSLEKHIGQEPSRESMDAMRATADYLRRLEQSRLRERLETLAPPSPKQLTKLRSLENEKLRAEATLESVAMKLTLKALTSLKPEVELDGRSEPSEKSLAKGDSLRWEVHSAARLVLPGLAEVQLQGGSSDAAELLKQRDKATAELCDLLAQLGVKDAEQAQRRADEARSIEALLEGKAPTEAELERLAQAVGEVAMYDRWSAEKLKDEARTLRSDADEAEAQWLREQRTYQKQKAELEALLRLNPEGALQLHLDHLRSEAESWPLDKGGPKVPKLDKLSDAWIASLEEGAPTSPLRTRLEADKTRLEKEKTGIRAPEGQEVTPEAIGALQERLQSLGHDRERLSSRLNQDLGRLRERSGQWETLVRLRESQAEYQAQTRTAELQAAAIQRLSQTFRDARAKLQNDMVGPLQERVAVRLSRITGGRYRGLNLDDKLSPSGVIPREVDAAELTDLSFGTREQLLFLTRLALAEMLSEKHERQSLIFDDNLVHTDQKRMEMALDMLAEAAQGSQIVVLTCHPERYRGLKTASALALS